MYAWLVFVHLVGLVIFAVAHGASVFMAFRIRTDRDPKVVASHLAGSGTAIGPMYLGLLLLGIGGIGAAWDANLLLAPWVVASYVVLTVVVAAMYAMATRYYQQVRALVGDGSGPVDQKALDAVLDTRRPELLVTVGVVGLVVLVWLMVLKPG
jgi:hypothetical protein